MSHATDMADSSIDCEFMSQALQLAEHGRGAVEPNPLVGCLIVRDGAVVGRGFHQRFGGPHAEIEALGEAGETTSGADAYVTLEPCCHHGKTGPCTQALIEAGVARVIVGCHDPNPKVAGQGIAALQAAGIEVVANVLQQQAEQLIAPFAKLIATGKPWVIAKWAMTLDGKIASHTGNSQWISGEASRIAVHKLRGQVDAIVVGRGTALADDPLLTARPPGPRTPTRIVLDSRASLPSDSKLIRSIDEAPLLVVAGEQASQESCQRLIELGAEVFVLPNQQRADQLSALLKELGRRQMTNVLVEGGGKVLGTLFDLQAIDEVHVFVAPKLIGGTSAPSPVGGTGTSSMADALQLDRVQVTSTGDDIHIHGYLN